MERYNETIADLRSFPTEDMRILSRYQLDSCAVVGNAGSLLNASFGGAIDSHDAVVRLNQAPVEPPPPMGGVSPNPNLWRKNVGRRTTFRLVNTRWAFKYGDKKFLVRVRVDVPPCACCQTEAALYARPHTGQRTGPEPWKAGASVGRWALARGSSVGEPSDYRCVHRSPPASLAALIRSELSHPAATPAVVTRAPPTAYDAMAKYMRAKRVDVSMVRRHDGLPLGFRKHALSPC